MPKFIVVIGCCHDLQKVCPTRQDPDHIVRQQIQKLKFVRTLAQMIEQHGINLVAEEARHAELTTVEQLARLAHIYYANIDMPLAERERRGIPRTYSSLRDIDDATKEQARRFDEVREDYMFSRAKEFMTSDTKALVIVGQMHMEPLKKRFEQICDSVCDYDVTKEAWFDSSAF